MKIDRVALALTHLFVLFGSIGWCESPPADAAEPERDMGQQSRLLDSVSYIPPAGARPMPSTRAGSSASGGSRSSLQASVKLELIAPEQEIFTLQSQPTLGWKMSAPWPHGLLLAVTLLDSSAQGESLVHVVPGPHASGRAQVSLAALGFRLLDQKRYEWSISLCTDALCDRKSGLVRAFTLVTKAPEEGVVTARHDWFSFQPEPPLAPGRLQGNEFVSR